MLKSINSKLLLTAVIAAFSLYGCGADDEAVPAANLAAAGEILQYVPANSPYVMANLTPLPDDVMDKLEPSIDRVLAAYETILQEIFVMATEEAEAEGASAEDTAKAAAVIGELSSLLSIDGLRGAGIDRESRVVVYGNGLLPVIRFEVTDGELFEAAIARIEESAQGKMDLMTISGNPVRYLGADNMRVLVSVLDTQVAISLAPSEFDEDQLSTLLGFDKPSVSIASAGKLQGIADKYAFSDYFLGYFDLAAIAETVTGNATGLDADIFALQGDDEQLSEACRTEIREMAGIAPRMVMGYTDISTSRFDSQVIVEMRSDIAEGLTTLSAPVPGLHGDMGGLLSFGMSLDLQAMRDFVEAQIDAIEADPFECEEFADIQSGAAEARKALQQPVMPMIYDFRGFLAVIDDIQGLDMQAKTPPTNVEGRFLLAMKDAPALVSLGTMFSPELAGLDLQPNGEVTLLDLPQAQMTGEVVHMAMNDDALVLSIGDGAETKLGDMLDAETSSNGTVFNFSVDASRYYSFLGEVMTQVESDDENPTSPAFQEAMQEVMFAIADMYDRMTVDMRFSEDGVVFNSVVMLGE